MFRRLPEYRAPDLSVRHRRRLSDAQERIAKGARSYRFSQRPLGKRPPTTLPLRRPPHKQEAGGLHRRHFQSLWLVAIRVVFHAFMPRMFMVVAIVFAIVVAFAIRLFARFTAATLVNDASRAQRQ